MAKIKRITGVMWAADILTGQKPFPYIQGKEKPKAAAREEADADFAALLETATTKLKARRIAAG